MGNTTSVSAEANHAGASDNDGWPDMSDFLKKMKPDVRETALETKIKDGDDFATPLIIAAGNGQLDFVKVLLRSEANIEARGTVKIDGGVLEGCTPLLAAAAKGHRDVVRLLIKRNAKVDSGASLRIATFDGCLDTVSHSFENGAYKDACTTRNNTPLMIASYKGHRPRCCFLSCRTWRKYRAAGQQWRHMSSLCREVGKCRGSWQAARFRSETKEES